MNVSVTRGGRSVGSRRMQVERDFLWFGWGQESLQLLVKIVLTFVIAANGVAGLIGSMSRCVGGCSSRNKSQICAQDMAVSVLKASLMLDENMCGS
mmetsp:Transcript_103136/g.166278  ORF Transcript_103136/g.166278 Transcript_103136/m.166278 type:complete len:96 (-) Transcript_103136:509-796(-)